jgi:hypothetical protein
METYGASEFFGLMLALPFLIYLFLSILDGIGLLFRDPFFISNRRQRD